MTGSSAYKYNQQAKVIHQVHIDELALVNLALCVNLGHLLVSAFEKYQDQNERTHLKVVKPALDRFQNNSYFSI